MADSNVDSPKLEEGNQSTELTKSNESSEKDGLEDFISAEYERQKAQHPQSKEDEERTASFFARAMQESQRMNAEISKSKTRLQNLHSELGSELFGQWQQEHATEVLTPAQMESVGLVPPDC